MEATLTKVRNAPVLTQASCGRFGRRVGVACLAGRSWEGGVVQTDGVLQYPGADHSNCGVSGDWCGPSVRLK